MQVSVNIDDKAFEYLMSDCPSTYWAEVKHENDSVFVRDFNESTADEPGPWVELTDEKRLMGLETMANLYPRHFGNFISDHWDGETSDVWLQCTVLGKIIYG